MFYLLQNLAATDSLHADTSRSCCWQMFPAMAFRQGSTRRRTTISECTQAISGAALKSELLYSFDFFSNADWTHTAGARLRQMPVSTDSEFNQSIDRSITVVIQLLMLSAFWIDNYRLLHQRLHSYLASRLINTDAPRVTRSCSTRQGHFNPTHRSTSDSCNVKTNPPSCFLSGSPVTVRLWRSKTLHSSSPNEL